MMLKRAAVLLLALVVILTVLPQGTAIAATLGQRVLSYGERGYDVAQLQRKLNGWGYWSGPADGIFGHQTYRGVLNFQRTNGLPADGIVGPVTLRALGVTPRLGGDRLYYPRGSFTKAEVDLLARLVSAEAKGEPYMGQVAVAAVVLNRLYHRDFPDTMWGVIYDYYGAIPQFDPVVSGEINRPATDIARRATIDALNGWDPTNGALVFYNPAKTTNQWVRNRPLAITIGDHVFRY